MVSKVNTARTAFANDALISSAQHLVVSKVNTDLLVEVEEFKTMCSTPCGI